VNIRGKDPSVAAGVFYKAGLVISPAAGVILTSLGTVIVAVNARMLRFGGGK